MSQANQGHEAVQNSSRSFVTRWIGFRVVAPIAVSAVMVAATFGSPSGDVYGPLVWTLFVLHLLATFAFPRSHVLDTGAFVVLIPASGVVAGISERAQLLNGRAWLGIAVAFSIYAMLSFAGRYHADHSPGPVRSVQWPQVLGALVFLFVAVIFCSVSKTGVGFLLVPGILVVPVVLVISLLTACDSRKP